MQQVTQDNFTPQEILEAAALQEAGGLAVQGARHTSRLARLPVGGWHAGVIRKMPAVAVAENVSQFKEAMGNHRTHVIFLPHAAFITAEIIDAVCFDYGVGKLVVWETPQ